MFIKNFSLGLVVSFLTQNQIERVSPRNRCFASFPSDSKIECRCTTFKNEKELEDLLGSFLEPVLRFNRMDKIHALQRRHLKIPVDLASVIDFTPLPIYLEQAKNFSRYIFIDLNKQFLGAYEFGELKFSMPVTTGKDQSTPRGKFKILERNRAHRSSLYTIKPGVPYPMFWGIKFHISRDGIAFWIHSRDMPGYAASHGCVGLYDEEMQKKFYGIPKNPILFDSKKLYLWLFPDGENDSRPQTYLGGLPDALIEIR